jgi:hypothetical protein
LVKTRRIAATGGPPLNWNTRSRDSVRVSIAGPPAKSNERYCAIGTPD